MAGETENFFNFIEFNFHLNREHSLHYKVLLARAAPRLLSVVKLLQWEGKPLLGYFNMVLLLLTFCS